MRGDLICGIVGGPRPHIVTPLPTHASIGSSAAMLASQTAARRTSTVVCSAVYAPAAPWRRFFVSCNTVHALAAYGLVTLCFDTLLRSSL